jgi:hypothetical protein
MSRHLAVHFCLLFGLCCLLYFIFFYLSVVLRSSSPVSKTRHSEQLVRGGSVTASYNYSCRPTIPDRTWKEITWTRSRNLSLWYSQWELCLLNQTEPLSNFKVTAKKKCHKRRPIFRCHLGNTMWCKCKHTRCNTHKYHIGCPCL